MARREPGIWRRLNHPNIVPFLGTTTGFGVDGSISLVSLWMPNGNLQEFLQQHENLEVEHQLQLVGSFLSFFFLTHFNSYSILRTDYTIVRPLSW